MTVKHLNSGTLLHDFVLQRRLSQAEKPLLNFHSDFAARGFWTASKRRIKGQDQLEEWDQELCWGLE